MACVGEFERPGFFFNFVAEVFGENLLLTRVRTPFSQVAVPTAQTGLRETEIREYIIPVRSVLLNPQGQ